jgi:hypothetical protein
MKHPKTFCRKCDKWYRVRKGMENMSCCVMHAPGSCCHYNEEVVPMKEFFVIQTGQGYGCDYTIGCNERTDYRQAESAQDIIDELFEEWDDYVSDYAAEHYSEISIVEAAEITKVDIDGYVERRKAQEDQAAARKKEAAEKAEYERLKKKFG